MEVQENRENAIDIETVFICIQLGHVLDLSHDNETRTLSVKSNEVWQEPKADSSSSSVPLFAILGSNYFKVAIPGIFYSWNEL